MGGPSRIDQTPVRLNTKVTESRQTPKSDFGSRVSNGLSAAGSVVAAGASVAAPIVPGGAILSAAVNGMQSMSSSGAAPAFGGGGSTTPAAGGSPTAIPGASQGYSEGMSLLSAQQQSNMQFLTLQNQMQQENQQFSTLSNVMKVRADTAKNSIQNIR